MKVLAGQIMQIETWERYVSSVPNIEVETTLCWWLKYGRQWAFADQKGEVHIWHGTAPTLLGVRPLICIKGEPQYKPGEKITCGHSKYTVLDVDLKKEKAIVISDKVFTKVGVETLDQLEEYLESEDFKNKVQEDVVYVFSV